MHIKAISKKSSVTAMVTIAMFVGVAGASVLKINSANAQSVSATPAAPSLTAPSETNQSQGSSSNTAPTGTFKSNENPAHEAKESAQWEAQENAGQAPWQQSNGSH